MPAESKRAEASQAAEQPASPRHWRIRLFRIARLALLVYLGLILVFYALQTSMVFPGASNQGQSHTRVRPILGSEILSLRARTGEQVAAMFGHALQRDGKPHPGAAQQPTVLFFYGNGMSMSDCISLFIDLRQLGFNVLIPDYLGYGMSEGKPSEAGVYAAADAAYNHLRSRQDVEQRKIVVVGWSLGASAAIELASREPVAALATLSAFTSIADMARRVLPFLPTSLMVKHRFENERKISQIRVPTFIAHGRNDEIVPHEMSERLERAAGGPVTRFHADSAHNDLFDIGGQELLNSLKEFIERATSPDTPPPPPVL
jgi:uncharacterized protein